MKREAQRLEKRRLIELARAHAAASRAFRRCPRCSQSHAGDPAALARCLEHLHVPVDELEAAG